MAGKARLSRKERDRELAEYEVPAMRAGMAGAKLSEMADLLRAAASTIEAIIEGEIGAWQREAAKLGGYPYQRP